MGLTKSQIDSLIPIYAKQAEDPYTRTQQSKESALERDAKLAQLIKGAEIEQAQGQADLAAAQQMRKQYGPETDVAVGRARIGGVDPLMSLLRRRELSKPSLTPAQEYSEREAGKKLSAYDVAGGRATSEKNIQSVQDVEKSLRSGERDWWDRKVGGLTQSFPSIMGAVAPTEKGRRDKAYSAAVGLARQIDPNPTQQTITDIMNQIYDPGATDESNLDRLAAFQRQQRGIDTQMGQSSQNLERTGYAMPGIGGNPSIAQKQSQTDKVIVISPDGKRGMIPRANLQRALQQGYRTE